MPISSQNIGDEKILNQSVKEYVSTLRNVNRQLVAVILQYDGGFVYLDRNSNGINATEMFKTISKLYDDDLLSGLPDSMVISVEYDMAFKVIRIMANFRPNLEEVKENENQ